MTTTGIPIELLFAALGGLISIVYYDLRRGQRDIAQAARRRDILLARICERLGIEFNGE